MRRQVFGLFEFVAALIAIGIVIFIATLLMRGGLWLAGEFFEKYVPIGLHIMWQDKWYIVAAILAALLVWSLPSEEEQTSWRQQPVRRGRSVMQFPRAAPRAYQTRKAARSFSSASARSSSAASGSRSKIRRK